MLASLVCIGSGNAKSALRLKKPHGLGDRRAFLRVQGQGQRFRGRQVIMQVARAPGMGAAHIGFTVSRRVGNAVVRNRVRRRLKEIVRLAQFSASPDHEFVLIALPSSAQASFGTLQQEVQCLLDRVRGWASQSLSSSP